MYNVYIATSKIRITLGDALQHGRGLVVGGLRVCGAHLGPAALRGQGRHRPAGADHQGAGHALGAAAAGHEPQLPRLRVHAHVGGVSEELKMIGM